LKIVLIAYSKYDLIASKLSQKNTLHFGGDTAAFLSILISDERELEDNFRSFLNLRKVSVVDKFSHAIKKIETNLENISLYWNTIFWAKLVILQFGGFRQLENPSLFIIVLVNVKSSYNYDVWKGMWKVVRLKLNSESLNWLIVSL